jgi:hypothetical protein
LIQQVEVSTALIRHESMGEQNFSLTLPVFVEIRQRLTELCGLLKRNVSGLLDSKVCKEPISNDLKQLSEPFLPISP